MSWAEDEGHDAFSVLDDIEYAKKALELDWQDGIHIDRQGNVHELADMTTEHLENTIRFFKNLDTSPLQEELNKRNINQAIKP